MGAYIYSLSHLAGSLALVNNPKKTQSSGTQFSKTFLIMFSLFQANDFPNVKIEENNPEVLAKKIIEQGRSLERSRTLLSPPANHPRVPSLSVEVRRIEAPLQQQQQQPQSISKQQLQDQTRYEHRQLPPSQQQQQQQRSGLVDLPKMEMNMSLAVSSGMGPMSESALVLPPHPPSRSASSELNDDVTFSSSKMSATPRAEQFETRLKNIIQSVLAGDADQDVKPPLQVHP